MRGVRLGRVPTHNIGTRSTDMTKLASPRDADNAPVPAQRGRDERGAVADKVWTAPLHAWRRRGDWLTRDALWQAACWVASGLERATWRGRTEDFERAAKIVDGDPEAGFAVSETLRATRVEAPNSTSTQINNAAMALTSRQRANMRRTGL
jgi:hypothetical protein